MKGRKLKHTRKRKLLPLLWNLMQKGVRLYAKLMFGGLAQKKARG